MDFKLNYNSLNSSPAFIVDEHTLVKNLTELLAIKQQSDCKVLYSIKALPLGTVLKLVSEYLDGFSVSSLFEARLAKQFINDNAVIHITTPGLRVDEIDEISEICSHISFNSIHQYNRLSNQLSPSSSVGIRVNPKLSFSTDIRFDPCRQYSKLGVDLQTFSDISEPIDGLHFHTVFSNTDYYSLEKTVQKIQQICGDRLSQLKWINIGGGYLFDQINNHALLIKQIKTLQDQYQLDVYLEPGKAIVGNAGYLLSTVIDTFISDGKQVAVLDTSVNHNPEVFEYQRKPQLLENDDTGDFSCQFVGSSCLAGDVFGDYQLKIKPEVGSKFVFASVGAYSLIKANRFNGYHLPDIYLLDRLNQLKLLKQDSYQQYRSQWVDV